MNTIARLVSCSLLAACTSSAPGSITGTIHGVSYPIVDAVSAAVTITDNGVTSHMAVVSLVSVSGACNDISANSEPPNVKAFAISLGDFNGTSLNTPAAAGTYTIYTGSAAPAPASLIASADASVTDATCTNIANDASRATSGTVTLTSADGNVFDGSFDVMMDSGDHVTGTFAPEACPGVQNIIGSTSKPACT